MSEKIRVLIVDDLLETRENVRKLLQFESDVEVIAQAGTGEQAVEMAKQHKPDIILMDINMPGLDGIGASQAIVQSVPTAQIIIMSVQSEADYLRRAMLAGARDFLMKPFSGDELITAVRRVYQMRPVMSLAPAGTYSTRTDSSGAPRPGGPQPSQNGHIIAVYSPKGGSGTTTIAINLAIALAQRGNRTLLIDGSLQFGDVAVMLNMKPTTTIVDLVDRMADLDGDLISNVTLQHQSGLKVLMAPPRPEMADLVTEEHVKTLLKALRPLFAYVIIDTSSRLNDVALTMLDGSDRILLVTQQNLPTLKNVSRFFDLCDTLHYEKSKVLLVVNRVSNKSSILVKDIADILKRPVLANIPVDEESAFQAADQGRPLVTGRNQKRPIAVTLTKLAEQIAKELQVPLETTDASKPAKTSFWDRLFGRRSQPVGNR